MNARRRLGPVDVTVYLLLALSSMSLLLGFTLPTFSVDRLGSDPQSFTLPGSVAALAFQDRIGLALVIALFSMAFPAAKILAMGWIQSTRVDGPAGRRLTVIVAALGKWSMLDVFVVAILIGAARLRLLSEVTPEPGIYWFASGVLTSMLASYVQAESLGGAQELRYRMPSRNQRTLGILLGFAGLGLFCLAILMPLMHIERWLFWQRDYSIMLAAVRMLEQGERFLPAVIGVFVIVLPMLRFLVLLLLRLFGSFATGWLVGMACGLERWSMWDVYALGLALVVIKLGDFADVEPRIGLWLLLAAIGVSLLDGALFRSRLARDDLPGQQPAR